MIGQRLSHFRITAKLGDRLFYTSKDGKLMQVSVDTSSGELRAGAPTPLFEIPEIPGIFFRNAYDPAPDGDRFLVALPVEGESHGLRVRTGWSPTEAR